MFIWMEAYLKHSALNFGQALQGLRYLFTHPDMDRIAPPGTVRHAVRSLPLRIARIGNDLFFTVLPPQWHHSREELETLRRFSVRHWFQCGYGPYRFVETGDLHTDLDALPEPRWDPRCRDDSDA